MPVTKVVKERQGSVSRTLMVTLIGSAVFAFGILISLNFFTAAANMLSATKSAQAGMSSLMAGQLSGAVRWKKEQPVLDSLAVLKAKDKDGLIVNATVLLQEPAPWVAIEGSAVTAYDPMSTDFLRQAIEAEGEISAMQGDIFTTTAPIVNAKSQRIGTLVTRWDHEPILQQIRGDALQASAAALALMVAMVVFVLTLNKRLVIRPLREITTVMSTLATGDTSLDIPALNRRDEIGAIAGAVEVFKRNAVEADALREERQTIELEALQQRELMDAAQAQQRTEEAELQQQKLEEAAAAEVASKALQARITALLEVVAAASRGDLNQPIDCSDSDDELGMIAVALDGLFAELRSSFNDLEDSAACLSDTAAELNGLGRAITQSSARNTEMTDSVSQRISNVSDAAESAAVATEEMTATVKDIAINTSSAVRTAEEAVDLVECTGANIKQLSASSAGIGSVIKVITSIAEQTNLLALNATIEAARAGDAGKGFAVVANEVKDLAKDTARATEEIESRIESIQADTQTAVAAIEDISKIVRTISDTQSSIAAAVEQQKATSHELHRSIGATSEDNVAIKNVINSVSEQSRDTQLSAAAINSSSEQLSRHATALQKLLSRYHS